eukprot:10943283-Karenia_brevis.AAC.1
MSHKQFGRDAKEARSRNMQSNNSKPKIIYVSMMALGGQHCEIIRQVKSKQIKRTTGTRGTFF